MISLITFFLLGSFTKAASVNPTATSYCVPVAKIDFNPFREIKDGKELAYLMLLKSYISTESNEEGLLSQYEFSPDGRVFTGRVSPNAKWSDGKNLTAQEAAFGIAKTLTTRLLGERVRVEGTEDINQQGWQKKKYKGIELVDDRTFKLTFKSDIENLTGVVREALSTNSRHNRFWPIKLDGDALEVMFKFPFQRSKESIGMIVEGKTIFFQNKVECLSADMSIFPEVFSLPASNLVKQKSPNPSAITAQPNSSRLSLQERKQIIAWLRTAFSNLSEDTGVQEVDSFFLEGEIGYKKESKWSRSIDFSAIGKKKIVIGYGTPLYKLFLDKAIEKYKLNIELVAYPTTRADVDVQILSSGMISGRHVILQDILNWEHVKEFFAKTPKTKKILMKIAEKSASTLPPDLKNLQEFESIALKEGSLAPIARRFPTGFSKSTLPMCLSWNTQGELTFVAKSKCN